MKFPKNPTTSFVIRTYNEERCLNTVLMTLFAQSRLDFEVLLVDSGSTDKTISIANRYPIRRIIRIPHASFNYAYALNLGIRESWGELIGIISGHSVPISRTWYDDGVAHFSRNDTAAVTGYYTSLPDASVGERLFDLQRGGEIIKKRTHYPYMTNTNSLIRKNLWNEYPFDERVTNGSRMYEFHREGCEDIDWSLEMLSRGWNVILDPLFSVYHSHGGTKKRPHHIMYPTWGKINELLRKKPRPSYSFAFGDVHAAKPTLYYPGYIRGRLFTAASSLIASAGSALESK